MWIIQVKLQRWANHIWWIRKVGHQRNKKKIIKTRINHVLSAWHAKIFIAYLGDCLSKEIQFSHWPTKRYNWTKCFGWTQKHIPRSTDSLATQLTNPHNAFETSFMSGWGHFDCIASKYGLGISSRLPLYLIENARRSNTQTHLCVVANHAHRIARQTHTQTMTLFCHERQAWLTTFWQQQNNKLIRSPRNIHNFHREAGRQADRHNDKNWLTAIYITINENWWHIAKLYWAHLSQILVKVVVNNHIDFLLESSESKITKQNDHCGKLTHMQYFIFLWFFINFVLGYRVFIAFSVLLLLE